MVPEVKVIGDKLLPRFVLVPEHVPVWQIIVSVIELLFGTVVRVVPVLLFAVTVSVKEVMLFTGYVNITSAGFNVTTRFGVLNSILSCTVLILVPSFEFVAVAVIVIAPGSKGLIVNVFPDFVWLAQLVML